jgi:hypothetical protein
MNNKKPSYPQAHKSTAGSKKMPGTSTSNKRHGRYAKVTICSLTTSSHKPKMNALQLPTSEVPIFDLENQIVSSNRHKITIPFIVL